jgi:LysM repeat protein
MLQNMLPTGIYTFSLPKGKDAAFQQCIQLGMAGMKQLVHVVKKGESMGRIAELYGVSIRDVERWNHISRKRPIHPGQRLTILQGD